MWGWDDEVAEEVAEDGDQEGVDHHDSGGDRQPLLEVPVGADPVLKLQHSFVVAVTRLRFRTDGETKVGAFADDGNVVPANLVELGPEGIVEVRGACCFRNLI